MPANDGWRRVWGSDHTCAFCGKPVSSRSWMSTEAPSGKWFCYSHNPRVAQRVLSSYSNGDIDHVGGPFKYITLPGGETRVLNGQGRLRNKGLLKREDYEKILRLAGMVPTPRKPAKPKKKPRDRRYVR